MDTEVQVRRVARPKSPAGPEAEILAHTRGIKVSTESGGHQEEKTRPLRIKDFSFRMSYPQMRDGPTSMSPKP